VVVHLGESEVRCDARVGRVRADIVDGGPVVAVRQTDLPFLYAC
jgi:hypothetical protein